MAPNPPFAKLCSSLKLAVPLARARADFLAAAGILAPDDTPAKDLHDRCAALAWARDSPRAAVDPDTWPVILEPALHLTLLSLYSVPPYRGGPPVPSPSRRLADMIVLFDPDGALAAAPPSPAAPAPPQAPAPHPPLTQCRLARPRRPPVPSPSCRLADMVLLSDPDGAHAAAPSPPTDLRGRQPTWTPSSRLHQQIKYSPSLPSRIRTAPLLGFAITLQTCSPANRATSHMRCAFTNPNVPRHASAHATQRHGSSCHVFGSAPR